MKRIAAVVIGAALVAALVVGLWAAFGQGGVTETATATRINWTLADVRTFNEYPVYYLGQQYQGLPLVEIIRTDWPGSFPDDPKLNRPDHDVTFIYGDCEIPPGEESCPAPLAVIVRPESEVPYEAVKGTLGPPECARGAKVQALKSGTTQLWTGDVTIAIVGNVNIGQAVRDLMRANGGKPDISGNPFDNPHEDCVGH
jgi:hypothetical protein